LIRPHELSPALRRRRSLHLIADHPSGVESGRMR